MGDIVRLNLRHVKTNRPCKKFDWIHAKYKVIEVVGSHSYRLNVPRTIHNVFHTWLLRPVSNDPLPSQMQSDHQPPSILNENGEEEWGVESILEIRNQGQGKRLRKQALVKWTGYQVPTWEPFELVQDTAAMENFELQKNQDS